MRVLSFIPAFLLAAASFVAAAPTDTPTDTSCASSGSNDASLQPVIDIIANATLYVQPLHDKLSDMSNGPCQPQDVIDVVVQVQAVVSFCIDQLYAVAEVDLSGLSLDRLCVTIFAHLSLVLDLLSILVKICISLNVSAVVSLQTCISAFLNVILDLLVCLKVYVVLNVDDILGDLSITVEACIDLFLAIFLGVKAA